MNEPAANEPVVTETIQLNKNQRVCKRHSDAICVYDVKKWPSGCPFCVAQIIANPDLVTSSSLKSKGVRPPVPDEDAELAEPIETEEEV